MNHTIAGASDTPPASGIAVLASSVNRGWTGLSAEYCRIAPGRTLVPGSADHRIGIHFGPSVNAFCQCDGRSHRRIQSHGDIDIVPAGLDGAWEDDASCDILRVRLSPALVRQAARNLGLSLRQARILPRFQLRDPGIEHIAWALKAELEAEQGTDRRYADSLGMALAVRLLTGAADAGEAAPAKRQLLSSRQSRNVLEFIDANLAAALSLEQLATVANIGVSHMKALFRETTGLSVHQYVIRCRVERARDLLLGGRMTIADVALECGFAHQSHMAHHMRRILGVTPGMLLRSKR